VDCVDDLRSVPECNRQAYLEFRAAAGRTYLVVVSSFYGSAAAGTAYSVSAELVF
jgi:hypothetical protein